MIFNDMAKKILGFSEDLNIANSEFEYQFGIKSVLPKCTFLNLTDSGMNWLFWRSSPQQRRACPA
jgi:hypothetical protein